MRARDLREKLSLFSLLIAVKRMKKIGIIGGGFGLYGYVPAAFESGLEVHTLQKYKAQIAARPDISGLFSVLHFHSDITALLAATDILALAVTPQLQEQIITEFKTELSGKRLILEKPLSKNNDSSLRLLQSLQENGSECYFGFLAPYTSWFQELSHLLLDQKNTGQVKMKWQFHSAAFATQKEPSWKASIGQGGGCLYFYACHLVYCLALLDQWNISAARRSFLHSDLDTKLILKAQSERFELELEIDALSRKEAQFVVQANSSYGALSFSDKSIFKQPENYQDPDPRIRGLKTLLDQSKRDQYHPSHCMNAKKYLKFEADILKDSVAFQKGGSGGTFA